MSCYWGYRCRRCDDASAPSINHGQEMLEELKAAFWRARALLAVLSHACRIDMVAGALLKQLRFLNRHRAHLDEVVPFSELER